jgi:hypothetical protein
MVAGDSHLNVDRAVSQNWGSAFGHCDIVARLGTVKIPEPRQLVEYMDVRARVQYCGVAKTV